MPSDRELPAETIRNALGGDEPAFGELVRFYRPRLIRVAAALLANASDAEEVVQDTFVRLHRYRDSYDRERPLSSYLYRIAVQESYRALERRRRDVAVSEDDLFRAGWFSPSNSPADEMAGRQQLAAVAEALRGLTERERVCFVLRQVEGLSGPEIAELLGISEVTVRRFAGIARQKLAALLRQRFGPAPRSESRKRD